MSQEQIDALLTALRNGDELYMVAKGTATDGHDYYGPFPTMQTAADWAEVNHETAPWHIAAVRPK